MTSGIPVERSDRSRPLKCGVQPLRFIQHVRVERDNRIDGWTRFIVRGGTIEVHLHQLLGGEGPAPVGCVNVFDRRFHDLKTFLAFCSNVGGLYRHGYPIVILIGTLPWTTRLVTVQTRQPMPILKRFNRGRYREGCREWFDANQW